MSSTNKTTNLELNNWIGTDKPTRSDFVSDNTILDTIINAHTTDTDVHLSTDQKNKLDAPYVADVSLGDGQASKSITLTFAPKLVIYYLRNKPFSEYDATNGYTLCNAGIAANLENASLGSGGITLYGNTFTLTQSTTASNGVFMNLNKNNGQYAYVAFK